MRLYVGNIDYRATIPLVRSWLEPYGMILDVFLPLAEDHVRINKGFAFVTFATQYAAEKAIKALHHQPDPVWGRSLVVQPALERPSKPVTRTTSRDGQIH